MKRHSFSVVSVNISTEKGTVKTPVHSVLLVKGHGIERDAHAGPWHRQISLLALESIEKMRARGIKLKPGDFAENITTTGTILHTLPLGTKLYIEDTELEVTQIGKECHTGCAVFERTGMCIMPKEGIFAKVIKGGRINAQSSGYYYI